MTNNYKSMEDTSQIMQIVTSLQEELETLKEHVSKSDYLFSTHRHSGSDLTQQVFFPFRGYAGKVVSNVASTPFPSGWSVSNTATGKYTVTHNLNNTNYSLVANSIGTVTVGSIQSIALNTFEIWFYSVAGSLTSTDFSFTLTLN